MNVKVKEYKKSAIPRDTKFCACCWRLVPNGQTKKCTRMLCSAPNDICKDCQAVQQKIEGKYWCHTCTYPSGCPHNQNSTICCEEEDKRIRVTFTFLMQAFVQMTHEGLLKGDDAFTQVIRASLDGRCDHEAKITFSVDIGIIQDPKMFLSLLQSLGVTGYLPSTFTMHFFSVRFSRIMPYTTATAHGLMASPREGNEWTIDFYMLPSAATTDDTMWQARTEVLGLRPYCQRCGDTIAKDQCPLLCCIKCLKFYAEFAGTQVYDPDCEQIQMINQNGGSYMVRIRGANVTKVTCPECQEEYPWIIVDSTSGLGHGACEQCSFQKATASIAARDS